MTYDEQRDRKTAEEHPFRAVVRPTGPDEPAGMESLAADQADDEWSVDAIEEAYRRALEIADAEQLETPPHEVDAAAAGEVMAETTEAPQTPAAGETAAALSLEVHDLRASIAPRQILEALLFVGGQPLTIKRMSDVLGGEFSHAAIGDLLEELNRQYASENRPYEIRLGEGGYSLTLRSEYERIRGRVFGQGPKEVKLSQEILEVLAFVAYQQPVTRVQVEETGKTNAAGLLRQLLRRELVSLERGETKEDVVYRTTPRFLQLFGLASLHDLPQPEDVSFK